MDDAYTVVSSNGDGIPMEDENGAPLANAQGGGLEGAAEGEAPWLQDQDAAAPAPEVAAAAAPKPRVTSRFLSKYERARLLGVRSKQIRCVTLGRRVLCGLFEYTLSARKFCCIPAS